MGFDEDYFESEDFQDMLKCYESAINSGEQLFMDADELVDIADYYNFKGSYDQADAAVELALELFPHATLPNVFMAREALLTLDFDTARKYADSIEAKDDPDYHYLVAEIMIAEGRADEADSYLRDYSKTIDSNEYKDLVKDCANLFVDYGVSDKAYQWIISSKGDDSTDFKELMARALVGVGKYNEAEHILNELLDRSPYSTVYWNALANTQFMNEDYSSAITSSEYALAIDPDDAEGLSSKASGLFRMGNYEEALKYFRRYSEVNKDDPYTLLHQGICLLNLDRQHEACSMLQKTLEAAAGDTFLQTQVYQELAFCYSRLKLPQKAVDMLDKAEGLEGDHIDLMVIKGHILLENGLIKEAEEIFKSVIKESDSEPSVLLRIIVSLYDNHYVKACYMMFKKFFNIVKDLDEEFNEGYAYMALCCHDLGKDKEFLHYLQLAVKNNPHETRLVLSFLFPEEMEIKDYYDYMVRKMAVDNTP